MFLGHFQKSVELFRALNSKGCYDSFSGNHVALDFIPVTPVTSPNLLGHLPASTMRF